MHDDDIVFAGRCYPPSTLRSLMGFCQENSIHMISDEIYALSVFDAGSNDAVGFTSVFAIDPRGLIDTDRLHVLYEMSKVLKLTPTCLVIMLSNSGLRGCRTSPGQLDNAECKSTDIGGSEH